jgi:hypothetical protein
MTKTRNLGTSFITFFAARLSPAPARNKARNAAGAAPDRLPLLGGKDERWDFLRLKLPA